MGCLRQLEGVEVFSSILNVKVCDFVLIPVFRKTEPTWKCKRMQTLARCGSFVFICWCLSLGTSLSETQRIYIY